jgi:hypothetical protein
VEPYRLGDDGPSGCAFYFPEGTTYNAVLVEDGVEWTTAEPHKRGPIHIPGSENAVVTKDGGLRLRERAC